MKYTKQELINSIRAMKEIVNDESNAESIRNSIKPSLAEAKKLLADVEKPALSSRSQAKGKHMNKKQKKTLREIVASAKKYAAYAGMSEEELKRDSQRSAKKPGSRISSSGKKYREYRPNRTDVDSGVPHLGKGGQISSADGKKAKAIWNGMTITERYNWLKEVYNFPDIDNHGTSAYSYDKLDSDMKKSILTNKAHYSDENEFAEGGTIAANQLTFDKYTTAYFTPAAKTAFENAIAELEKDKDAEGPYYPNAKIAMVALVIMVDNMLRKNNTDAAEQHRLLQKVGIYNYKTGLLVDTSFLDKELAVRKLAKGGRLLSALNRDRAYKSQEPHEQAYKRKTSPKNPKYKYGKGGTTKSFKKGDTVNVKIGEFEITGEIVDRTLRGKKYKERDGRFYTVPAGSYLVKGPDNYKQWLPAKWLSSTTKKLKGGGKTTMSVITGALNVTQPSTGPAGYSHHVPGSKKRGGTINDSLKMARNINKNKN